MNAGLMKELLGNADITIDGPNPWDVQVHDEKLYSRIWFGKNPPTTATMREAPLSS